MKKRFQLISIALLVLIWTSTGVAAKDYTYTSVPNDPLKTRIYTLENGLKVFMSVNKETPRIIRGKLNRT